ncbi:Adenylyltransferase and sulfurtransferase MOCS3 [Exaiptasia diaphana]|nr:Adenylyltransferase and sulfurtransferase MOCS3 [Exaiptasia diaphana]
MADEVQELRQKLAHKIREVEDLKSKLREKENICQRYHQYSKLQTRLTKNEIARYSRQLILPEIGVQGQFKLKKSSVLIVGAGGLGCPSSLHLAAAGVGCIGLVDYDTVEISNLHRQVLHSESKVDLPKVESAKQSLNELNSCVTINTYHRQLNSQNALEIISGYDVIVDATDNVPTRYLLNDACVLCKKPLVSGSALRFEGQTPTLDDLSGVERVTAKEYKAVLDSNTPHILLDVREPVEMEICALPNALIFVVCRQGNDSQKAVKVLQKSISQSSDEHQKPEEPSSSPPKVDLNKRVRLKDIKGGLLAWAKQVDDDFPVY